MLSAFQSMYVHTEPPTAMSILRVIRTTSTSITIQWDLPVRTGKPDYYYVIEYSDPDDISKYIHQDEVKNNRYVLNNLRADTIYIIRVSVHNGVSDQDSENAHTRIVEVDARTREGCKHLSPVSVFHWCIQDCVGESFYCHKYVIVAIVGRHFSYLNLLNP